MESKKVALLKKQVNEYLNDHGVMVLSTATTDGKSHTTCVYYSVDSDYNFYFITGEDTTKFKNIIANKQVSFVVGTGPQIFTIQGHGRAEPFIKNTRQFMSLLGKSFKLDLSQFWPATKMVHEKMAMVKIVPESLIVLNLDAQSYPETSQEKFIELITKN